MAERPPRPIIAQIVMLVAGAIALATAVLFAVTFQGPPPFKPPLPVTVAAAILSGKVTRTPPDVTVRALPPDPSVLRGLSRDARAEALFAKLGVAGAEVWTAEPLAGRAEALPESDNAELRGGFTVVWQGPEGMRTLSRAPVGLLSRWHMVTLAAMFATLIVLVLAAWAIARTIAGPLLRLADAADATRALPDDPPIPVDGPSEVRRVAESLERMRDRLSVTLATRTEMLTGIAHDMGTPLTRLAFHADALPDDRRNAAQVEIAEMRAMIGSVLDFARNTPVERGPVDVAALLRQLVEGTAVTLAATESAIVEGDAISLKRLFANLIENALRYAGDCAVTLSKEPGVLKISVADTGTGLPDDPALLFEPFVRGEGSRNRATGGVGLGLAIARRAAEQHGGTITAASRPEGGAEFVVTLPA